MSRAPSGPSTGAPSRRWATPIASPRRGTPWPRRSRPWPRRAPKPSRIDCASGDRAAAEAAGQELCGAIDRGLAEGVSQEELAGALATRQHVMCAHRPGRRTVTDLGPALTLGQTAGPGGGAVPRPRGRRVPRRAGDVSRAQAPSGRLRPRACSPSASGPGDHVVLWMPNCIEWNVANLGIAKIGAVTVTCNSRYKAFEVEYVLRQSDAKALIMVDRFAAARVDYLAILDELLPEARERGPAAAARAFPRSGTWWCWGTRCRPAPGPSTRWSARAPGRARPRSAASSVRPDDPVEMLYTSGTTGEPKGCLLSHGNMYYKCRVYVDLHRWTHADRYLVPVPYFHIFGSMGGVAANCLAGSTQVVMDVFDARRGHAAHRGRARDHLLGRAHDVHHRAGPSRLRKVRPVLAPHGLHRRRAGAGGDHAAHPRSRGRASAWTPSSSTGSPRPPGARTGRARAIPSRSGWPRWGCARRRSRTASWIRRRAGRCRPGEEGEVCVKGPTLMLGYYKKPEATADKIRDGWLHTGDMGIKDADGYLRITGRVTDMIIVGGFNTYPAEIENFYLRHPGILDVSIVGVPDPVMGEVVMAFVIPKSGVRAHRRRRDRLRARQDRQLQAPALRRDRRPVPAHRLRQGPEVQAEGLRGREARPESA